MSFLYSHKKQILVNLGEELGAEVTSSMTRVILIEKITTCQAYKEEIAKALIESIKGELLEEQEKKKQEHEEEKQRRQEERAFELERLKLEAQTRGTDSPAPASQEKELGKLIPRYDLKEDISLYLILFERQASRVSLPKNSWVTHLLGLLPQEISQIIAREPEEKADDYDHVKGTLLKRFKLTPEKFRQLFNSSPKKVEKTWQDFHHELKTYFDGWLAGLNITTFEQLKKLIICDQMKKRAPPEFKEFYLDEWASIVDPQVLAEKVEEFEDLKKPSRAPQKPPIRRASESYRGHSTNFDKRRPLRCFNCGSPDHLRPNCPKLKKPSHLVNNITEGSPEKWLRPHISKGKINGVETEILRDTGATIDVVCQKFIHPGDMTGEHVWLQQPLDSTSICLPLALVKVQCELGETVTKAAVISNELDRGRYILGNRTVSLFSEGHKETPFPVGAVQTRSQTKLKEDPPPSNESPMESEDKSDEEFLPKVDDVPFESLIKVESEDFIRAQRNDGEIMPLIEEIEDGKELKDFELIKGKLLAKRKEDKSGVERKLLLIPKEFRSEMLKLCHEGTSGHLGATKTKDRLSKYFFWTNCYKDAEAFVKSCDLCQKAGKGGDRKKAPMTVVPVITEVFSRLNIDAVGPLPLTSNGKRYLITAMCMSSKYPYAVAVSDITSVSVVDALLQIFSRMGFPKEIQHDHGTSFMSNLTSEFFERFGIKVVRSSVYHPQSNPVERLHRTIKRVLRVLCQEEGTNWENHLHAVLFALRTVTHESTGFTPAELVHGRNLRTPITLLYENWVQPEDEENSVVEYIIKLLNRLKRCQDLAIKNMEESGAKRKKYYDRNTVRREFEIGDKVLVLAPSPTNKLAVQWHGPGAVEGKISETNYIVKLAKRDKSQIYHVNLLKPYHQRPEFVNLITVDNEESSDLEEEFPSVNNGPDVFDLREIMQYSEVQGILDEEQIHQLSKVLQKYSHCFSNVPGLTNMVKFDIELTEPKAIRSRPYRMSLRQTEILREEIGRMIQMKIVEIGESDFTSPMILVEVPGKDPRPCIDYRRLNEVTKTQYFPLPNIEERVEAVAAAKYITILDLSKGYWQIPLTERAKEYATFVTSFGSFRPLRMPFGLKNAPYYFSKMMAEVLRGCEDFAVPYLDDVAIFSLDWSEHLKHVDRVLERIDKAKLSLKASKCRFAQTQVKYLGHYVGQGKRSPNEVKIKAIQDFPIPSTKTQIRAFLGLAGYYRQYIPKFSVIVAPLTDLLKGKERKSTVEWNEKCQQAFEELKKLLTSNPVLYAPRFDIPFTIQCDASDQGIGVVLTQGDGNEEHPVLYLSKKFTPTEQRYNTSEKECAAIIYAVKKLQYYLDSHSKFFIQTDHNPLVWLKKNSGINPRLMRWALALQPWNYEVIHRKGKNHQNADGLSRLFN